MEDELLCSSGKHAKLNNVLDFAESTALDARAETQTPDHNKCALLAGLHAAAGPVQEEAWHNLWQQSAPAKMNYATCKGEHFREFRLSGIKQLLLQDMQQVIEIG